MTRLARLLWDGLPRLLGRASPTLGALASDGRYLAVWPLAAVLVPLIACVLGAVLAMVQRDAAFTYSIVAITCFVCASGLGAGVGLFALLGYATVDLFRAVTHSNIASVPITSKPVVYMILATVLVAVPVATIALREQLLHLVRLPSRVGRIVLQPLLHGVLVFAWAQATAFLIRPVWSFDGGDPALAGIEPLQHQWGWYVAAGMIISAGRLFIETGSADRAPEWTMDLPLGAPKRLSVWVSVPIQAFLLCLLMGGLLASIGEGILVFAVFGGALLLQHVAPRLAPIAWVATHVPMVVRMAVTLVIAAVIAQYVVAPVATLTSSFHPMVYSIVASLLVSAVLLPRTAGQA